MEQRDWSERWQEGQIGFHQPSVATALQKWADEVWGLGALGRVFVPLCGKTLDMVFLAERASAVIGVEYVEQAVVEFFEEQGLIPDVGNDTHTTYEADKYTVFASDFFAVDADDLGVIDAVYDRASLVALEPDERVRYAEHMRQILPSGARALLIAFHYDQAQMDGPPFSVPPEEVVQLFADGFSVEQLGQSDMLTEMFRARGVTAMTESVFALTRD